MNSLVEKEKWDEFIKAVEANPQLGFSSLKYGELPLEVAIRKQQYGLAKVLIENGALDYEYKKGRNPLAYMFYPPDFDMIKLIVSNSEKKNLKKYLNEQGPCGFLPLAYAIEYPNIVEYLLQAGAIPETKGRTRMSALFLATRLGPGSVRPFKINRLWPENKKKSAFLILNASKNKKKLVLQSSYYGYNIFQVACWWGNLEFIEYCLKNKLVDIHIIMKGGDDSLFYSVCRVSNLKMLDLFLKYGADLNVIFENGNTPLQVACNNFPKKKFIERLLEEDVDINALNNYGKTALDFLLKKTCGDFSDII